MSATTRLPLLHLLKRTSTTTIPVLSTTATHLPATYRLRRAEHSSPQQFHEPPPPPTPFVPDVPTFLKLIGRSMSDHAPKIPSWTALFTLNSAQLKDAGIEPASRRRYLLRWRQMFRRREWGVGGDLQYAKDGVGKVGIVELPAAENSVDGDALQSQRRRRGTASMTRSPNIRQVVVSLPPETEPQADPYYVDPAEAVPVAFVKIKGASQIYGPYVEAVSGSKGRLATISVREGLWEIKKGKKVDGGERRKAEVRAKQRATERRAARS